MNKRRIGALVLVSMALALATVLPGLAQDMDKDFWTNFTLVNVGMDAAQGMIEYIKPDGSAWGSEAFTIAEVGGQAVFRQYASPGDPGNPNLDEAGGSVIVSTDQPLAGIVQIQARGQDPTSNGAYSAFEMGAESFYVPLAAKGLTTASGLANSQITVQNSGSGAADVEIDLIASDGTVEYTADGGSLAPGASWYYDLADEANVPDEWYGSAIARTTTAGGSIAVASSFFTGDAMQTFNAFPSTAPTTKWFVPLFTSRLINSLSTPIAVQNLSGSPIAAGDVDVTCQPDPSVGGSSISMSNDTAIGHSASYFFNPVTDMTIPAGFYGACVIESTADVVAFVQMRFVARGEAAAYEAIPGNGITKVVSVSPLVAKRLSNGFATAVTVQNLSESVATTVDITYTPAPEYVDAGGSATPLVLNDLVIPAGGSLIQNHRILTGAGAVPGMPEGWYGTMLVESEDQPINGFVQLTYLDDINPALPGGDNFMAHRAFTR
jgi:hypothetical protein